MAKGAAVLAAVSFLSYLCYEISPLSSADKPMELPFKVMAGFLQLMCIAGIISVVYLIGKHIEDLF